MLAALNKAWDDLGELTAPPPESVMLCQEESVTVYVDDGWGPPVPYPPAPRENGGMNHGYVRLKGNLEAVASVPEVGGWPEYCQFLERVNAETSPIESVGCEKGFFPFDQGDIKVKLGSYTDLIFSELALNDEPRHLLRLADAFAQAMRGSKQWWSVAEIGIQRSKGLAGCACPWSLMLRVCGHGRDKDEAHRSWGASIDRVGLIVGQLPAGFPTEKTG